MTSFIIFTLSRFLTRSLAEPNVRAVQYSNLAVQLMERTVLEMKVIFSQIIRISDMLTALVLITFSLNPRRLSSSPLSHVIRVYR